MAINNKRNTGLIIAGILIIGAIIYLEAQKPASSNTNGATRGGEIPVPVSIAQREQGTMTSSTTKEPARTALLAQKALKYPRAKELEDPQGFINTAPFKLSDMVGKKVILLDFWTYSCINCQRTLPYLTSWYDKYKDKGFVIIGVHTPEFDFEKKYDNVANAVKDAGVAYPVVLDNNYGTWAAYSNRYWPREYLIDIDGYIVHDHIGEGGYDDTEKMIQTLLKERADVLGQDVSADMPISVPHQDDIEAASPETYFGSDRNQFLRNGTSGLAGEQTFTEPVTVQPNGLYLVGAWNILGEYAETSKSVGSPETGSDRIAYRYRAKSAYFVAGAPDKAIDVEVLLDSKPVPASLKGGDIFYKDGKSYVRIRENRLYRIIEGSAQAEHFLEFVIPAPGFQAYTFTFG